MAVLNGMLVRSAAGGLNNPYLTGAMHDFAVDYWPPHEALVGARPRGTLSSDWPVEANGRAISGSKARSYSDDYYHRIHVRPQELALGNVASVQTTPIYVWNAFLVAKTLASIDGTDEGLIASGQAEPPLLFPALKERIWQLSVTPDGQPVLDTRVVWNFGGGIGAAVRVTANRIIAWSFAPNWGDSVIERLSAATDILQSETNVEQRRSLRTVPRREFQAQMIAVERERQLLDLSLFGWGARTWAMPIWPDVQLLRVAASAGESRINCDTQYLDFRVGGMAMLRGESAFTHEVVQVQSIDGTGLTLGRPLQQTWGIGSRLYPARAAQLTAQPQLTRLTDTVSTAEVNFLLMELTDWPAVMPASSYRGWPVLEQRPDESQDLTHSFERLIRALDGGMSLPLNTDLAGRAFPVIGWRWLGMGRAERAAFRSLIMALNGQQAAVWVPTHADDLTLLSTISDAGVTLDIASIGYTRFGQLKPGRRDIRIELVDGTVFYRRIINSTETSTETERLAIDLALGRQVEPDQVARICWMTLARSNSDVVELEHITDSEGLASSSLTFKGVRDDEF
ncbi:hypothetical protein QO207_10315 [Pseudomonas sp. CAN2814]|uniref:hypothetical protein n=1 Tax=Pseudomonas sp. CAN1 TaxID=3046726 RepID=UPI002648451C|nr:hypothetical protein [Pseudomonas sp. CAN1]MDN6856981.1 hypothetical protein [Pseudomonas sp. CAN1]